ncbi:HD domain-containing protein [Paenibacillus abyssi]|uniref:HD-CE domain-containing protein n=1 Tax=Paenibacillus abyssi TaxID=1340531 RepID=A0A917D060_9BACL|nr:ATP-binding protein [Paenibacillus abyssi]GGG05499.1 hypothetical protein GCM10010916_23200 [Paenibacillus abyssi]
MSQRAADYKSKLELNQPRLLQYLIEKNSEFADNILTMAREVEPILSEGIHQTFKKYTLHNIEHSIRIIESMYDLIPDVTKISDLDIALLIYSALLHDIGMFVSEEEIINIQNGHCFSSEINYHAVLKKFNDDHAQAIQDYIRRIHAKRSADFVRNKLMNYLSLPSQPASNFSEEVALICESHTQDSSWLKNKLKRHGEKGEYSFNTQFCAVLLRLSDILDIDSQRTPPKLFELIQPTGNSSEEWRQHFVIENRDKIKTDERTGQKSIVLYGHCSDSSIHRKILGYIDWINNEIQSANSITSQMNDKYKLLIQFPVENNIQPQGYTLSDLRLSIDYKAISNLLMGEKIYGDRILGLRELIQNAIDACKVRGEIEAGRREYGEDEYNPSIRVILDAAKKQVSIKDNGTGMSMEILKKYFLNIGVSYYQSDDFSLRNFNYKPIGNFGIGFLACFMLSDDLVIKTRHYQNFTRYDLEMTKDSPFICLNEVEDLSFEGTEVILNYDHFMNEFSFNITKVRDFLQQFFLTDDYKLNLIVRSNENEIYTIENSLKNNVIVGKEKIIINLSNYLVDVEGFIELELSKSLHYSYLNDLSYAGVPYYYDGNSLIKIDDEESFDLSLLCHDHTVRYLNIPIISNGFTDDYDKIFDVLDSRDETISKLTDFDDLEWITIFIDKEIPDSSINVGIVSEDSYIISDNLHYSDLRNLGQAFGYPTKVYKLQTNIFLEKNNTIYFPFSHKDEIYSYGNRIRKVYIRNIFVKDFSYHFMTQLSKVKVTNFMINVLNKNIVPDISRNTLSTETGILLNHAINKVIYLWVLENFKLPHIEKELLTEFIDTFYTKDNPLIKMK